MAKNRKTEAKNEAILEVTTDLHQAVLGLDQPLAVILLEDHRNAKDGTTAEPSLRCSAESVGATFELLSFHNRASFVGGFTTAVGRALSKRVLLVISVHGKEATGTQVAAKDETFAVFEVMHEVPQRPSTMTVFLSMCWGGYPGVPSAIQWRSNPAPLVVGAIVEIDPGDANAFQSELVKVVADKSADAKIVDLVKEWNQKLFAQYHDMCAFAVVDRTGSREPEWGANGFAGVRLNALELKIVALQRSAARVKVLRRSSDSEADSRAIKLQLDDDGPDVVVAMDSKRRLWHMNAGSLAQGDDTSLLKVGQCFKATATRTGEHTDLLPVVGLTEVKLLQVLDVKKVHHKFDHAVGVPDQIEGETKVAGRLPQPCLTCRWGAVGSINRIDASGKRLEELFVICTKRIGTCRLQLVKTS